MTVDPELENIGRVRGEEIWRINDFALERVPKNQYGCFYSGDSYIVLHTEDVGRWNVHFWLGKDTSVDEQGSAAIKTVELDDALGGKPVQYREVQNHESSLFLSYFKQGIKYLAGGVKSGMRHVEVEDLDDFEPRMFQCRGKRNVRCSQVPCEASSLNLGDVFILDKGSSIYVWCPPESDRLERIRGMGQAASIRDSERGGKPTVEVLDQDWDSNEEFWSTLGGRVDPESIKPKDYTVDEDKVRECKEPPVLYRAFDDDDGELKIEEVSRGPFDKDDLRSEDAFILDVHAHGVFVWIGKHCSKQERIKAMQIGTDFVKREASQHRDGRSSTIPIVRVLETAEPPMFTQWSKNWPTEYTVERYHAQLFQCSYDQGKFTVEEISRFTQEDLDGDDVMILDTFNKVYVWIGKGANSNEKANALDQVQKYLETDALPRDSPDVVEVHQGDEPNDFKEYFPNWDDEMFQSNARSFQAMRAAFCM